MKTLLAALSLLASPVLAQPVLAQTSPITPSLSTVIPSATTPSPTETIAGAAVENSSTLEDYMKGATQVPEEDDTPATKNEPSAGPITNPYDDALPPAEETTNSLN